MRGAPAAIALATPGEALAGIKKNLRCRVGKVEEAGGRWSDGHCHQSRGRLSGGRDFEINAALANPLGAVATLCARILARPCRRAGNDESSRRAPVRRTRSVEARRYAGAGTER